MDSFNFISKIFSLFRRTGILLLSFYSKLNKAFWVRTRAKEEYNQRFALDKKLVFSLAKSKIPGWQQIKHIKKFLTRRELWLMRLSLLIFAASFSFLAVRFFIVHLEIAPARGGEYSEGLVGAPKYVNPLYASFSDVDSDISRLVFSSLLKRGKDGRLVNDLTEDFTVSSDGKIYTFKIRPDVKWHNGVPLTVDDIFFTFNTIKDARFKSPLRESFVGVEIEKENENTVRLVLKESYAAFPELLTFGIMPQDLWYQISPPAVSLAELNLKPVGSGPYKFKSLLKDKNGQIKAYSLTANNDYYGFRPYITDLTFKFFPDFSEAARALNENNIDGISYLPRSAQKDLIAKTPFHIYKLDFSQIAAIFFNQKVNEFLGEKAVRQALAFSIDQNGIIENILGSEARLITGPVLPDNFAYNTNNKKYAFNMEEAGRLLDEAGWKIIEITAEDLKKAEEEKNATDEKIKSAALAKLAAGAGKWRSKDNKFLSVKLTTVDTEDNSRVAAFIKESWEKLGIKTGIELVLAVRIRNETIKPRNFSALLYGEVMGADPDAYAFWHSSQANENGLNLANYANKEVDRLLEEGRLSTNVAERTEKYKKFQEVIIANAPAIFIYAPVYSYIQNKKIKGFGIKNIFIPSDRFANIAEWHIKTKKKFVW